MNELQKITYCCVFCGKHHSDVKKMFCATEHKCICNECLDLCNEIANDGEIIINVGFDGDGSIGSIEKRHNAR